MKIIYLFIFCLFYFPGLANARENDTTGYLGTIIAGLQQQWPDNRTINLVFHGHSVPAGYFKTPDVQTLNAYPQQVLKQLKQQYPYAVINCIVTAIGGENSESGAQRFERDVLIQRPDVLMIDYALNDRGPGLEKAKKAWSSMIEKALREGIKVILLTPSPDTSVDILQENNILEQHSRQIRQLAAKYKVGLADSYAAFKSIAMSGQKTEDYMSQVNHPNTKGHILIAEEIMKYFQPGTK
ncbi:MAG: SGNH/GDSL hydrolase family protein [Chitinophagaceae bacterium]|nr:SGNH/GDSL hydrolase family protein [Chitinophagaceae bacterium]